jgi:hypothetical protein
MARITLSAADLRFIGQTPISANAAKYNMGNYKSRSLVSPSKYTQIPSVLRIPQNTTQSLTGSKDVLDILYNSNPLNPQYTVNVSPSGAESDLKQVNPYYISSDDRKKLNMNMGTVASPQGSTNVNIDLSWLKGLFDYKSGNQTPLNITFPGYNGVGMPEQTPSTGNKFFDWIKDNPYLALGAAAILLFGSGYLARSFKN